MQPVEKERGKKMDTMTPEEEELMREMVIKSAGFANDVNNKYIRKNALQTDGGVIRHNKYHREIMAGCWVDVYDVIKAWGVTNPALQHLIKKALQTGERGHKDRAEDLKDILDSAKRAIELES